MDPFTERMLERARARREKLDKQLNSVGEPGTKNRAPLHENNPSIIGDPPEHVSPIKTLESSPRGKRLSSSSKKTTPARKESRTSFKKSPRKKCTPPPPPRDLDTDPEERTDDDDAETGRTSSEDCGENLVEESEEDAGSAITDGVRSRLRRLGALYSDAELLSSPIHRTENNFSTEPEPRRIKGKSALRSARLAALASSINQWEDDPSHPSAAGASSKGKATQPVKSVPRFSSVGVKRKSTDKDITEVDNCNIKTVTSPRLPGLRAVRKSGGNCNSPALEVTASPRQLQWDKAMLDSLEAQGYCRSDSNSRLTYDFEQENMVSSEESESHQNVEEESPVRKNYGSPIKTPTVGSPARSPLVMGVAQLRKNISPVKQPPASPGKNTTSPIKSFIKTPLKTVSVVDDSQPEGSVLQRAAKYESEAVSPPKRLARDPAELPLAERMALFEKNKGPLLIPKVPFSTPMPAKLLRDDDKIAPQAKPATSVSTYSPTKEPSCSKSPTKNSSSKSHGEESAVLRRLRQFETGKVGVEDSPSRPQNQAVAERQKEMEMLSNRWTRNKALAGTDSSTVSPVKSVAPTKSASPPPPPPMPSTALSEVEAKSPRNPQWRSPRRPASKDAYPGVSEVKRIKVSPPKPGHLYPSLSDVEATTETEDLSSANQSLDDEESSIELGTADDSFGKDILEAAEKVHSSYRSTLDSKDDISVTESAVLRDMDDFLEDAMGESSDEERIPTPPKKTRSSPSKKSDSFYYRPAPSSEPESPFERKSPRRASTKYPAPQPPSHSTPAPCEQQQTPLVHTVSFYRKQQNMTPKTPARQVHHEDQTSDSPSLMTCHDAEEEKKLVEIKVRQLLDDVSKQQTIISQASQALNLCIATVEFACSAEQVEAERLLLHATHKRQAALNEIQRLRVEGTLRPSNAAGGEFNNLTEHGTLLIKDIALPVKPEFVRSLAIEDNSQHFVCLAKCQDIVLATTVASISSARDLKDQAVCFLSSLTLNDLPTNFRVTLEVYTFSCRREMLPHDVKYHISKKDGGKRMTPRKPKQDSHLARRPVQSPAGPGAVRTSQFNLVGYVIFSLREIQRSSFTLNKVPYTSPLQGSIQVHMDCDLSIDIEHRGFLSMYDVVSGFGAWHRRWCLLKGDMLSFWKYPEHESKDVAAIDSIDLKTSVSDSVGLAPRDVCARLHTFLLETTRPLRPTDEDSLVMTCKGNKTLVRHLLSADTREERIEWCDKLNKALSVMRAWNKKGEC